MILHAEDSNGHPTETSPLLSRISSIEPADGITPAAALATAALKPAPTLDDSNGEDNTADGASLERQDSVLSRAKQYEGLPEVRERLKYILPAMAIGIFLSAADQTIIVSSYGKIGSELNALNQTSWIATAYFLTLTSFQPLYGKLSDIFGRKSCLLFGYTVFGIGCLGCGLAQNIIQLIAARAFAGIGGSAMTTVVSILMSDAVSLRERGTWQGYINIIYAAGSSAGAPLGGVLADHVGWRWAFLGQVPLCFIAFVAVAFALNLPRAEKPSWRENLHRIDFPGSITLIAAVFLLLFGLDRASNVSWSAPVTLVPLCMSIPSFVAFIVVEMKVSKEPIAPERIIFSRAMIACYLCNFFSMAGWLSALFYLPLYFQAVSHVTATGAGVRLIPSVILGVCGSLFAGVYMQRTGRYYWLTVIAYAALTLGMVIIFSSSGVITHSSSGILVGMCINGFANGNGITTTLIGVIANASHEDQAVATACSYLFRSLGSVFGVSMSATVANQALRRSLATKLPALGLPEDEAYEIANQVRQSLSYLKRLHPKVRAVVADCYAQSTTATFGLQIGLSFGAAISAWFIWEKVLTR